MNNQELIEEIDKAWVLSEDNNHLIKQDYDVISTDQYFAVKLKTGRYTILKKTENFDDEVLEKSESYDNTLRILWKLNHKET